VTGPSTLEPRLRGWRDRLGEISDRPRLALAVWWSTVASVSLLHLFTRWTGIGSPELWLDESSTWGIAHRGARTVLTLPTEFHSQPPLYYLLLHYWMKLSDSTSFMRGYSWLCVMALLWFILFCVDELSLLARVGCCMLFVLASQPGYFSTALRPYGQAALWTFVSTVWFLRLVEAPTRRGAIRYGLAALVMLYTMAFDVWVFVAHGIMWTAQALVCLVRRGPRAAWAKQRIGLATMAGVSIGYLPYLLYAIHWQYQKNANDNFRYALLWGHQVNLANDLFGFSPAVMTMLALFVLLGVVGQLRRDPMVLTWLLIAWGQACFVVYFMEGRNSIGPAGRYVTPSFCAVCIMASFGLQQLAQKSARVVWMMVPLVLAYTAWLRYDAWAAYVTAPLPVGDWGRLREAMLKKPADKVIFFDIGYSGQDFEYVARKDRSIRIYTMRGKWLASGGDDHLDPGYIHQVIADTYEHTSCYYYWVVNASPSGVYSREFIADVVGRGYSSMGSVGQVASYCRTLP
jgi:uncharacterized membrane protein